MFIPNVGMPGVSAEKIAGPERRISVTGYFTFLPAGRVIDGAKTRDANNDSVNNIRAGTLMGKVTASGKYANSVIGQLVNAAAAGATSLTIGVAEAVELNRRGGPSGTLTLTGPPTAGGPVAAQTVTYSAVNTATGVVTCSALAAAAVAGSLVGDADGSQTPLTIIPDGYGEYVPVTPYTTADIPFGYLPVQVILDPTQLLPWPADPSLQAWVKAQLKANGDFLFTDAY